MWHVSRNDHTARPSDDETFYGLSITFNTKEGRLQILHSKLDPGKFSHFLAGPWFMQGWGSIEKKHLLYTLTVYIYAAYIENLPHHTKQNLI